MQNSKTTLKNELLVSAVDKLWEAIRLSAESILELKTKVKNLEDQNSELYSSFINSDEESANLKLIKADYEAKSLEQDSLITSLSEDIKELNLRLDSAAIYEHKYTEVNRLYNDLQDKYNSSEQRSKNELLEKIKELEDSHTNYGFLQKELTRRNFDMHQRDEAIQRQKDIIASMDSRLFILKDVEKKYSTAIDKLESLEQTFNDLTSQRDKLMEKLQESKANNEVNNIANEEKLSKYKEELEKQAEAIELYTNKLNNFNIERASWNTTKDEYLKTIDTLYDDITLFKEEITNSNEIIENLKAHNDTISTKDVIINEQNLKLKQLNAVIIANESALAQFSQKVRESEHKYNNVKQEETLLKDKLEEITSEYEKDKERILSYEKSLTELQISVNEKDDRLFKLDKDLEELIEANCSQESEIYELKSKIDNFTQSNNELLDNLENENNELKIKIENLILSNNEFIATLETENLELKARIDNLNYSYAEFIKNIEDENSELKSRIVNSYQSETVFVQALENENSELKAKIENSTLSNIEFLQALENENSDLKAKIEDSTLSNIEFLQALETENIEMKLKLQENSEIIENFRNENIEIKRLVDSLKESSSLNEIDLKASKERTNELERQLSTVKDIISSKDSLFAETKALNELYQLKNQQLTTSLMEKDKRLDELNLQIAKSGNTLSSEDLIRMQNDINDLNNAIKERDSAINDLNDKRYELESLIKKRYEHIEILEKDLDNEVAIKKMDREDRIKIANQIQEYMSIIEKYLD